MEKANWHDRLRVALLTPSYWPEVRRGMERDARDLADGLIARGHSPTLITSHRGAPRRRLEDGLPVLRLPRPPQGLIVRHGFEAHMTHIPFTYMALRAGAYDLAHALYPTDALAAAAWRRATGRPALLTYLGIPARAWLDAARLRKQTLMRAVRGCDAVVVISHCAAAALRESLGHEPYVIRPGVDLRSFKPMAPRSAEPSLFCAAPANVPRKNVGLLVEAFRLVKDRHPGARLVLVRPQDPEAAKRAGVDLRAVGIEWIDPTERAGVLARAYSQAWVAVLPAVDEAFGKVLVEALACGTPVVGYAGGGIPEIIDRPGIGHLFGELEPRALAQALLEALGLAEEPATAGACRARAQEFSLERCIEAYLALYRQLLRSRDGDQRGNQRRRSRRKGTSIKA